MGRKRIRSGQYVCLCLALLGLIPGCSLLQDREQRREMRESMAQGQTLLARGDFDGSLSEYQKILSLAQELSPGDAATFNIGLIHAHPNNPKKDSQKAIDSFDSVIHRYPQSPLATQAKIWIGILNEAAESRQEIERSKQAIEKSHQEVERSKQIIEKSKQEIEKTKQEIEKSKQVIEKSKQVDIEIEQKRRERGR